MVLEICANGFQSAYNAQIAGAHRIELCQELSVGGLTPSYGLLKKVITELTIPVFVLIRPRSGDFVYSVDEFEIMRQDINICKALGAHGIVSGILNRGNTIDMLRTKQLVALSAPLPFTFHRAFDEIDNQEQGLTDLIELGVDRILTSGQETTAEQGITKLCQLKDVAQERITIIPGGGINMHNAGLFKAKGFSELHASASLRLEQKEGLFSAPQLLSDQQKIKDILNAL
jgi:copper homeostasis protein